SVAGGGGPSSSAASTSASLGGLSASMSNLRPSESSTRYFGMSLHRRNGLDGDFRLFWRGRDFSDLAGNQFRLQPILFRDPIDLRFGVCRRFALVPRELFGERHELLQVVRRHTRAALLQFHPLSFQSSEERQTGR